MPNTGVNCICLQSKQIKVHILFEIWGNIYSEINISHLKYYVYWMKNGVIRCNYIFIYLIHKKQVPTFCSLGNESLDQKYGEIVLCLGLTC